MIANDMFTAKIEIDDNKYYGNKKQTYLIRYPIPLPRIKAFQTCKT